MRLGWKRRGLIFGAMPSDTELERIEKVSPGVRQWYDNLLSHHNALRAFSIEDGRYPELADCVVRFWMRWHALEHGDPRDEHVKSWRAGERALRIAFINFLAERLGIDVLITMNRLVLMASLPLFHTTPEGIQHAEEALQQFRSHRWWWPYELPLPRECAFVFPPEWGNISATASS